MLSYHCEGVVVQPTHPPVQPSLREYRDIYGGRHGCIRRLCVLLGSERGPGPPKTLNLKHWETYGCRWTRNLCVNVCSTRYVTVLTPRVGPHRSRLWSFRRDGVRTSVDGAPTDGPTQRWLRVPCDEPHWYSYSLPSLPVSNQFHFYTVGRVCRIVTEWKLARPTPDHSGTRTPESVSRVSTQRSTRTHTCD